MPEGHTLHRFAQRHGRLLDGRRVGVSSPQGRFAEGAARIDGAVVERTEAYGKHLFHRIDDHWLHIHLGLFGKFRDGPLPAPEPRGALRLRMTTDEHWIDLRGPTACELLVDDERAALLARLGPDPLRRDADPDAVLARIARSRAPIATLLMDQSVVAGIGNVYRAEILFRHRIDPYSPGRDLDAGVFAMLWADLVTLMRAGVRSGRIVTTDPADREHPGGRVRRGEAHYVYRRTGLPCRRCGTPVATAVIAARNLFWCPACQA